MVDTLSGREREIAQLVALGLTNKEIGERLYLSDKTVKNYVASALSKCETPRRAGLARYVITNLLHDFRSGLMRH